jgi:hypothetical protein
MIKRGREYIYIYILLLIVNHIAKYTGRFIFLYLCVYINCHYQKEGKLLIFGSHINIYIF